MSNLLSVDLNCTAVQRVSILEEWSVARTALSQVIRSAIASVTDVDNSAVVDELLEQFSVHEPGLVLIGVRRTSTKGEEAVDRLLLAHPSAAIIVYGSPTDAEQLVNAIQRGARGLLLWDAHHPLASPAQQRTSKIDRLVHTGDVVKMDQQLSERELQILRGMMRGLSNREIGRKLFLSEDTVKTHARRLFYKLDAHDRAHAVAIGLRYELVA